MDTKPVGVPSYMRLVRQGAGRSLELAWRTFAHPQPGKPVVLLAATTHIADEPFYRNLQATLDGHELVLYELLVASRASPSGREETDEDRARYTRANQRWLAIFAERFRREHKRFPATLEELIQGQRGGSVRLARWAALDGWGRQNAYELRKGRFDIRSDGADGRPGGERANADILFSGQPPLSKQEVSRQGIIPRAAHALGLAAQAEHIDVHGPNWRRCDRTYADLEIPAGPAAKELHGLLDIVEVRSVLSRAIALALTVISLSPGLARVSKLILAEALDATWEDDEEDDPLTNVVQSTLIDFRNAAVKEELLAIFEKPSPPASIGILYGAGHMEGIERDLRGLGYVLREETWHAAIVVKPEGVAPAWDIAGLIAEAVAARVARRKPARKSERD